MSHEPVYLTLDEGAKLLRFDATAPNNPTKAFTKWLHRQAVPVVRRGSRGRLLVERRVLLAFLNQS